jgi:hypothetical protein
MAEDENIYAFAIRRERELQHQIAAIKGQIATLTGQLEQRSRELSIIQKFRHPPTIASGAAFADGEALVQGVAPRVGFPWEGVANRPQGVLPGPGPHPLDHQSFQAAINDRFKQMTIKELSIQALLDHFPTGANATLLRDFIRDAYNRVIAPSSLRPQLHRLQAAGILYHDPASDLWNITSEWRGKYLQTSSPFTGVGAYELERDEASEPKGTGDPEMDSDLMKLAQSLAWRDEDESEPE